MPGGVPLAVYNRNVVDPSQVANLLPLERTFDGMIGADYAEITPERVAASLVVRDELLGLNGCVPVSVYFTLAESMASFGTAAGVFEHGKAALGLSQSTSMIREVSSGRLDAVAERVSAEPDLWIWRLDIRDEEERLCAVSTAQIAVRPRPGGS